MLVDPGPLFVKSFRVSDSDREWLEAEARRLRRETGETITPSEVMRRAIKDARARRGGV